MKQFFDATSENASRRLVYKYCPACGSPFEDPGDIEQGRQRCSHCHYTVYFNPYPGVVVLIVDKDKILLGKRTQTSFRAGYWCLPGGFLEFDENFLAAAHREVYEETGLRIRIRTILNVVSNFLSNRLHTLVIVLLATSLSSEAKPGDDLDELAWFSLDEPLPPMAFEADEYIIRKYAHGQRTGISADPRFELAASSPAGR